MTANGIALEPARLSAPSSTVEDAKARGIVVCPMLPGDVEPLIEMGAGFHGESVYSIYPYSPSKLRRMAMRWINSPSSCFSGVAWNRGKRAGFFMGGLTEPYFSEGPVFGFDILLYVVPGSRGGIAASLLLRQFLDWAFSNPKTIDVKCGVSAMKDNSRTYRFYEKMGGEETGRTFTWRRKV